MVYTYRCQKCFKIIEVRQSIHDAELTECDCTGILKKIINGAGGFILNGKGYYSTDNKAKA